MKSFLSKYWKRILILITGIFIVINIISKCVAPHILVDEYAKYGPDVEKTVDIDTSELVQESPFNSEMTRIIIIAAVAIVGACIIGDLASKKSSSASKKKK